MKVSFQISKNSLVSDYFFTGVYLVSFVSIGRSMPWAKLYVVGIM